MALLKILKNDSKSKKIIFCNSTISCEDIFNFLKKRGYNVAQLHSSMNINVKIHFTLFIYYFIEKKKLF